MLVFAPGAHDARYEEQQACSEEAEGDPTDWGMVMRIAASNNVAQFSRRW